MKKLMSTVCVAAGLALPLCAVVGTTGCAGDQNHRSTQAYVDDKEITARIKTDLVEAKDIKSDEIKVRTNYGRVQLSGFVDSVDQKQRAGEIASHVQGVQWVMNDLIVKDAASGGAAYNRSAPVYTNNVNPQVQEPAGAPNTH